MLVHKVLRRVNYRWMSTMEKAPKAAICVIANEVLSGKTLDTNSNYLAKFLFRKGIDLVRINVIPDDAEVIAQTVMDLSNLVGKSGYVFTSGGIGPTHDDITYESIAKAFDVPLEVHEPTCSALSDFLAAKGQEINEDRLRMVMFPKGANVLKTASWVPIVAMKNVYILPGIPRLLHQMIESTESHFKGVPILQAQIQSHLLEGVIATGLKRIQNQFPSVMIGSYVNTKEDDIPIEKRSFQVQVTLYSRSQVDIDQVIPLVVKAIDGWVVPCLNCLLEKVLLSIRITMGNEPMQTLLEDLGDDNWTEHALVQSIYDKYHKLPLATTEDAFDGTEKDISFNINSQRLLSQCRNGWLDLVAASIILSLHLMTFETFLVICSSGISTSVYFYYGIGLNQPSFGANLSWTIVSFAVVSPMIMQIRQAFVRRELALDVIAEVKALMCNVLIANLMWNWGDNQRNKLPKAHAQKTKQILYGILIDLQKLITLPTFTRGRHQFTSFGKEEARDFLNLFHGLSRRITFSIQQLHYQVEIMKVVGLPANEASRINQYHWLLQARIEKLCNIKLYRTPQATRSFTRLSILLLPLVYGPYYVYIATATPNVHTNLSFALILSVVTSLIMIGIFNVELALEDPFTDEGLDGVKVPRVIAHFSCIFKNTNEFLDIAINKDAHKASSEHILSFEIWREKSQAMGDQKDWTEDPLLNDAFQSLHEGEYYMTINDVLAEKSNVYGRVKATEVTIHPNMSFFEHCQASLMDWYAAGVIFWSHLVNFDSFLVLFVSIGATTGYYYYTPTDSSGNSSHFAANLSWILVTFAIVSPMIMQIKQAFTRRENALDAIAEMKAIACNILLANTVWNWGNDGRQLLPAEHNPRAKVLIRGLAMDLYAFLKMPTFTRGRHRFTSSGVAEAKQYNCQVDLYFQRMMVAFRQLHNQIEVMKGFGLPPNEASRANQYHWFLQARFEKLCNIKLYRTPQATRSFIRLCILLLPLFYGPYYVYIISSSDGHTNFAFALVLSAMTSITMIGIFNVEKALEDPFTEEGLDGIQTDLAFRRFFLALDTVYSYSALKLICVNLRQPREECRIFTFPMSHESSNSSHDWTNDPLVRSAFACINRAEDHYIAINGPMFEEEQHYDKLKIRAVTMAPNMNFAAHCHDSILDLYTSCVVFWSHLINFDSAIVFVISIVAPIGYYYYTPTDSSGNSTHFSANISWILITFAVVSPMIMQIRQAFTRRENALDSIAEMKAIACNILLANTTWNWGKNGRQTLPPDHNRKAKLLIRGLLSDLYTILKMPTFTRGRHRFTKSGVAEAAQFNFEVDTIIQRMMVAFHQLHLQVETMKAQGIPANEASRINQYHWFLQARFERLCNIKLYRTPQATRSFTRLMIMLLPLFYGPYYVYISSSRDGNTSFAFALVLSAMTSLVMIGIFNVEKVLEDPFTQEGLDSVQLDTTFRRLFLEIDTIYSE
ncbi:hypothetical protein THRCLA_08572 [Thraustotheca clavata]|uniref:MoaB/Mog domain-containing protein n=1 Tax=Thraustotheca clavata TaxID=74557 RepID=A0A1V9Z4P7_9STRA|nr:hypothetical protein THRCLA_08572 [Thraustotheca clavata]